jgi:branched-chain amino acid transport system substrate-binding protein
MLGIAIMASLWAGAACAQTTVYIPDVIELSGPGAVSGTN